MGDLWGVLLLVGQILVPFAALGFAVYVVVRLVRAWRSDRPRSPDFLTASERRLADRTAWWMGGSGLALPWLVGLAVKAWLDHIGEPTFPVSSFLEPTAVVVLLAATVAQWCWPFLALAFLVRSRLMVRVVPGGGFRGRLVVGWVAYLGGVVGGLLVFIPVFRSWDTMAIFVPLGVFLLPPMLVGYGVGRLVLRWRGRG